jgi:hypothetical protein
MFKNSMTVAVAAAAAFALVGCGSSSKPSTTATVGTAGATLTAGAATLTIPAGALTKDTTITLREAEPNHAGRADRVEVQPHDALAAGHEAHLSVKVNAANPKVKMHKGDDDSIEDVEVEDRNHHSFKTNMSTLDDVEVEVDDGKACAAACSAVQECDDGVCKDHDGAAKACTDVTTGQPLVCGTGEECDNGACKTHMEFEADHHGNADPTVCSPTCDLPAVCHEGICAAHG